MILYRNYTPLSGIFTATFSAFLYAKTFLTESLVFFGQNKYMLSFGFYNGNQAYRLGFNII